MRTLSLRDTTSKWFRTFATMVNVHLLTFRTNLHYNTQHGAELHNGSYSGLPPHASQTAAKESHI